jgi:hypothetical protein
MVPHDLRVQTRTGAPCGKYVCVSTCIDQTHNVTISPPLSLPSLSECAIKLAGTLREKFAIAIVPKQPRPWRHHRSCECIELVGVGEMGIAKEEVEDEGEEEG